MTPLELRSLFQSCKTPLAFAEAFDGMTEADRKKLSKTAQEIFKEARALERENFGMPSHESGMARLALLACCSWNQAKRVNNTGRFPMFPLEGAWTLAVRRILLERRPSWADDWIAMRLQDSSRWQWWTALDWNDIRELMKAGVIRRPTVDGYLRLLAGKGFEQFDPGRDADVFESDVWQLFAIDTTAFDGVPEKSKALRSRKHGDGASPAGEPVQDVLRGWPRRIYDAVRNGTMDRGRLIDAALAALWGDVRGAMRIGLLRFLDLLEATDEEAAAREATYRDLLRCDYPAVVGMALQALAGLYQAGRLDVRAFLHAAPAVFTLSDKNRPAIALSLIDRVTPPTPGELPFALPAVAAALGHESAEIQEAAVKLLAKWKEAHASLDLTEVLKSAPSLAAHPKRQLEALLVNTKFGTRAESIGSGGPDLDERRRSLLDRLAGLPQWVRTAACLDGLDRALEEGSLPPAYNPDPAACRVLSGVEPVEPITTVEALIDAVLHLIEVVDGPEAIERIIDGLMRLGGETTDDFEAKTAGLRQTKFGGSQFELTTTNLLAWSVPSFVSLLGRWLGVNSLVDRGTRSASPAFGAFDQRVAMLVTRFRSRRFGPALATPTHRGGWIDPRVFVGRMKSLDPFPWIVHRFDLIGGLLRLAPDFRAEALRLAADLPNPYGPIVRYALGGIERPTEAECDRADEWLAAGRARDPRGWLEDLRVLGLDEDEPDGITQAVFRFEPAIDPAEYAANVYNTANESPPFVQIVPPILGPSGREARPTVAMAGMLANQDVLRVLQSWQAELLASLWPANPAATLGIASCKLAARIDLAGLYFEPVSAWMSPLHAVDRGWSEMARTALWLGLLSRNDQSRGTAIDALIEGIADGRADAATLAETLLHIASGGWAKLNRLADSLREVTRISILAERVVAEILDRLIASWQEWPRDGHHVLALQVELLSNLQQAPSPAAREALTRVKGGGKAGKLAKRLCALDPHPHSTLLQESAIEAAEGRLARADRIRRFVEGRC